MAEILDVSAEGVRPVKPAPGSGLSDQRDHLGLVGRGRRARLGKGFGGNEPQLHRPPPHGVLLSLEVRILQDPDQSLERQRERQQFHLIPPPFGIRGDIVDAGVKRRLAVQVDQHQIVMVGP